MASTQSHHSEPSFPMSDVDVSGWARTAIVFGLAFGIGGMAVSVLLGLQIGDALHHFWHAYLATGTFYLSITLGALFFVILHHLVRAGWSTTVRRIAEAMSTNVLLMLVIFAPFLLKGLPIYEWMSWTPGEPAYHHDHVADGAKTFWYHPMFFVGRLAFCFAIWIIMAFFFHLRSVRQDETGDVGLTNRMQLWSAPAIILFALTTTFASFDLLMSLDPWWFSTMFGVYFFAGGAMGFFAILSLLVFLMQRSGKMLHVVHREHYHDMGKLLFAFTCFWAYVAFSQYMLQWYANMPEETEWWQHRHTGAWGVAGICFLVIGHFVAPFVLIISRWVKRIPTTLAIAALWMLAMHYFDHYWLVMPHYTPNTIAFGNLEIALIIGMGGLWIAATGWTLRNVAAVPIRDPRLQESLAFENF